MRVVLCYPVEEKHFRQIVAAVPSEWEVVNAGQERIATEILAADIFCGHAKVPVPWDDVVRLARLKWIQSSAAGMDHCLVPSVAASEIVVTSASGVLANQVAEHAIGLMTALCRSLPVFFRAQQKKEFIRRPTRDLHHSTVGIVGFGGVGRRLAEILSAFKTRILATDLYPIDKPSFVESLWPPERQEEMIAQVDFLVLCAPITEQTRGMINARTLNLMKPSAFFLNMARGKLIVENDLADALEAGWIAGAAVDVTPEEPLPETSRLWNLPNLIITPHVAGQSARRIDDMTDFFCDNIQRYLARKPLRNLLVDKRLGFPMRQ